MNFELREFLDEVTKTAKRVNLMLEQFHRGDIQIEKHQSGAEYSRKTAYFIKKFSNESN